MCLRVCICFVSLWLLLVELQAVFAKRLCGIMKDLIIANSVKHCVCVCVMMKIPQKIFRFLRVYKSKGEKIMYL